ncbi:uncharacterized protein LOC124115703 [Haliotis rufescens]|uniref:uncharacterized protein LOC124115703 n=1 Tax=Haliotis rufescens TaxID=6454 RepID=UPI00201EA064|nr:uncharacterized protein LOC124115703 [Haliotis rufescens]
MPHKRYLEICRSDTVQIHRKPLSKPTPHISLHRRKVPFLRKPYVYHVVFISGDCDSGTVKDVRQWLTDVGYSCCDCHKDVRPGQQQMKGAAELIHKSQWIVIVASIPGVDELYSMLINIAVTTAIERQQKCLISLVSEKSVQKQFPREINMFLQVQLYSPSWKDHMLSLLEKRPTVLRGEGDQPGRQFVHRGMSYANLSVKWLPRCMTSVGELTSTNRRTSALPYTTFRKTKTDDFPPVDNVGPTQILQQETDGAGATSPDVTSRHNSDESVRNPESPTATADSIQMSPNQNQAQPTPEDAKLPEITLQKQGSTFQMQAHNDNRCLLPSTYRIDRGPLISTRRLPFLCSLPLHIPGATPNTGFRTYVTDPSSTKDPAKTSTTRKPPREPIPLVQSWGKSPSIQTFRLRVGTPRPVLFIYGLSKHND